MRLTMAWYHIDHLLEGRDHLLIIATCLFIFSHFQVGNGRQTTDLQLTQILYTVNTDYINRSDDVSNIESSTPI